MTQTIKEGFKYFTVFIIFFACFLVFMVLVAVFMDDRADEEIRERQKWCDEYHPNLTMAECSKEAGW